jgi:hypothetical protein
MDGKNESFPITMFLAVEVVEVTVAGTYDTKTDTWSDRAYACAAEKKHNEEM